MKHEKRVRQKGSPLPVNQQSEKTPAPAPVLPEPSAAPGNQTSNPVLTRSAAESFELDASGVLDDFEILLGMDMPDEATGMSYILRDHVKDLIESGRALAGAPVDSEPPPSPAPVAPELASASLFGVPKAIPSIKPFGPFDPPEDTDLARLEIMDVWKESEKMELHDGVANLFKLVHCIENGQWLKMESRAFQFFGHLTNVLGDLRTTYAKHREDLSAAECWIVERMNKKPSLTFWETFEMLRKAKPLLTENAGACALAEAIDTMNRWLDVIVDIEAHLGTV